MGGNQHISEQSMCVMGPTLKLGDTLTVKGYYDDRLHPQMTDSGHLDDVMAIAILYIAPQG